MTINNNPYCTRATTFCGTKDNDRKTKYALAQSDRDDRKTRGSLPEPRAYFAANRKVYDGCPCSKSEYEPFPRAVMSCRVFRNSGLVRSPWPVLLFPCSITSRALSLDRQQQDRRCWRKTEKERGTQLASHLPWITKVIPQELSVRSCRQCRVVEETASV